MGDVHCHFCLPEDAATKIEKPSGKKVFSRNYIHFSRGLSKIHIYGKVMVTKIVSLVFSSGQHMIWHQKITTTKTQHGSARCSNGSKGWHPSGGRFTEKSLTKYLNHTYIFDFHVSFLVGLWTCILWKTNIAGWKMDEDGPLEDLYTYQRKFGWETSELRTFKNAQRNRSVK